MKIRNLIIRSVVASLAITASAAQFHVAPYGEDSNPGTKKKPFLTIEKARDAARAQGDTATIILHAGKYRLADSLRLDSGDSYTSYRAAESGCASISGGVTVPMKDLKHIEDPAIVDRVPEKSRGRVVELSLPGKGSGGSETWPLRFRGYAGWPELYVDGKAMRLARWPNDGYATIAKVLDPGSRPRKGEKEDRGGRFLFEETNPSTWKADEPIYLGGYWCYKWFDEFIRVDSVDSVKKEITMAAPHKYGLGGPSKGLYFAINLLEELDEPGEYVYDGKQNKLYMILPENVSGTIDVAVLKEPLISARQVQNLRLEGIVFENGCASAIDLAGCESIRITDCTIRQMSGTGVVVSDGRDCGVLRSCIHTVGKTGVTLSGGDRQALIPSRNFVKECDIYNFARLVKTYCPAVGLRGVGQVVSNNHFHDAPHCAVLFHGNDHQITFNLIEHVCMDTSDAGAIYCGRDWTLGGNRIHGNLIRDLGKAVHNQTWGIYLDDMASGLEVSANIVMDTDAGLLIGGGRNNVIKDNIIANCPKKSIMFDARGVGWVSKSRSWLNKPDGTMWKRLQAVSYDTGIWKERFPYLGKIESDGFREPRNNVVTGNRIFKSAGLDLHELVAEHGTVENNITVKDMPEIVFKNGRLKISDKEFKSLESMRIGPSRQAKEGK